MNNEVKNQRIDQPVEAAANCTDENLNFDLWAKSVRRQLLAALQKRAEQANK